METNGGQQDMNAFEALGVVQRHVILVKSGRDDIQLDYECAINNIEKSLTRLQHMENNIKYAKANFRMDLADAELIDFIENGLVTND